MSSSTSPSRRTLLAGLAGTGAVAAVGYRGWQHAPNRFDPEQVDILAGALRHVPPAEVGTWLHRVTHAGADDATVLAAAMVAGVIAEAEWGDLHQLLVSGPALRIGPRTGVMPRRHLTLWVLLYVSEWLAYGTGTATPPEAVEGTLDDWLAAVRARDVDASAARLLGLPQWRSALSYATFEAADPHPTVLASEVAELAELAESLSPHSRAVMLASAARHLAANADAAHAELSGQAKEGALALSRDGASAGGMAPEAVAETLRTTQSAAVVAAVRDLAADGARPYDVWSGLWALAAQGVDSPRGVLNTTHALTATAAGQRVTEFAIDPAGAWRGALCTALRLVHDGPIIGTPPPGAVLDPEAWQRRGIAPGSDPHDLKMSEALLGAAAFLDPKAGATLLGPVQRSDRLTDTTKWPGFEAAAAAMQVSRR